MTPTETAAILRNYNEWRLTEDEALIFEIGEAIDVAVEMIERLGKVESALSDLLNDLEDRAQWNLEESQRVVACGNGVYMRAKAALEESK